MPLSLFPIANFPNEIFATAFSILFILIILFELRILSRNRNQKEDKNSLILILIGIFLPLIIMISLSYIGIGRINNIFSYSGLLLIILGFTLRQYSINILGEFFTPVVAKKDNQKIIQKGPYKYIRHPSYTGLFLEVIGAAISFANWISIISVLILFIPAILYRINIEENFLSKNFKEYKNYQKKTWKLIPFIF